MGFDAWRHANNIPYEPFRTGSITLKQLKAVAAAQGTDIKFGDVLLIRSGKPMRMLEIDRVTSSKRVR